MKVKELIYKLKQLDSEKTINIGEYGHNTLTATDIEKIMLISGYELGINDDEYVIF